MDKNVLIPTITAIVLIGLGLGGYFGYRAYQVNDKLPASMRAEFMGGCLDGTATNKAYCTCTFNYMDSHLTNSKFYDLALEYDETDVMPKDFNKAIMECL
jgi:hypothetical protein